MRMSSVKRAALVIGAALVSTALWAQPVAAANTTFDARQVVTNPSTSCFAQIQPTGVTGILGSVVPRIGVGQIDSLLPHPTNSYPDCPAAAEDQGATARGDAALNNRTLEWALGARAKAAEKRSASASAGGYFPAAFDVDKAGALYLHLADVAAGVDVPCNTSYECGFFDLFVGIFVRSSAGEKAVGCFFSDPARLASDVTLPDERCGVDDSGKPVRLRVGVGHVEVQVSIQTVANAPGNDPALNPGPVRGDGVIHVRGRVASFELAAAGAAPTAGAAPASAPAADAKVASAAASRPAQNGTLPRTGRAANLELAACFVGALLVTARLRARLAPQRARRLAS